MDIKRQYNEIEWLSDYLDDRLSVAEKSVFEKKLENDEKLRASLALLQSTKVLLRESRKRRAPHNFSLTQQTASSIRRQVIAFPILRFSSALTGALSILIFAISFLVNRPVASPNSMLAAAPMAEKSGPVEQPMIITWGGPGYGMGGGGGSGGAADLGYGKGGGGGAPQTMSAVSPPIPPEAPQPDVSAEKSSPSPTAEGVTLAAPETAPEIAPAIPMDTTPVPTQQADLFQPTQPASDTQRGIQPPSITDTSQLPAITGSGPILGINPSAMNPVQTNQKVNETTNQGNTKSILVITGSIFLIVGLSTGITAFIVSKRKF
jgi:hypothetical protein